ncbi:MAG: trimeric intracellular cation channel family protein [Armatimonadota bacterium]
MIYLLDLFGSGVFAMTGALAAGRKRMDVFGVIVVSIVTALGGGTLRDLVLARGPVFWVSNSTYLIVAGGAGLLTFAFGRMAQQSTRVLPVLDAVGLAVFTVIGCQKAAEAQIGSGLIVAVMGVMTGVAGGVARDVLCGEIPLVLRKEIYATASLLGGAVFVALWRLGIGGVESVSIAGAVVLAMRLSAIHWRLALPVFTAGEDEGKEARGKQR